MLEKLSDVPVIGLDCEGTFEHNYVLAKRSPSNVLVFEPLFGQIFGLDLELIFLLKRFSNIKY